MSVNSWLGHWYLVRARRAELAAIAFKKKAETFFQRVTARDHNDDGTPMLGIVLALVLSAPIWAGVAAVLL